MQYYCSFFLQSTEPTPSLALRPFPSVQGTTALKGAVTITAATSITVPNQANTTALTLTGGISTNATDTRGALQVGSCCAADPNPAAVVASAGNARRLQASQSTPALRPAR